MANTVEAAEELLRVLEKCDATLSYVGTKLSKELDSRSSKVNLLSLVQRIRRLEGEMPELITECQSLIKEKQALVDTAKQLLVSNHMFAASLSARSGKSFERGSNTQQAFQQALAEWDNQVTARVPDTSNPGFSREELNSALASTLFT